MQAPILQAFIDPARYGIGAPKFHVHAKRRAWLVARMEIPNIFLQQVMHQLLKPSAIHLLADRSEIGFVRPAAVFQVSSREGTPKSRSGWCVPRFLGRHFIQMAFMLSTTASSSGTRFLTVSQWTEQHSWPPLGGLRSLIFHAASNGFDAVVRRIGRRVHSAIFDGVTVPGWDHPAVNATSRAAGGGSWHSSECAELPRVGISQRVRTACVRAGRRRGNAWPRGDASR